MSENEVWKKYESTTPRIGDRVRCACGESDCTIKGRISELRWDSLSRPYVRIDDKWSIETRAIEYLEGSNPYDRIVEAAPKKAEGPRWEKLATGSRVYEGDWIRTEGDKPSKPWECTTTDRVNGNNYVRFVCECYEKRPHCSMECVRPERRITYIEREPIVATSPIVEANVFVSTAPLKESGDAVAGEPSVEFVRKIDVDELAYALFAIEVRSEVRTLAESNKIRRLEREAEIVEIMWTKDKEHGGRPKLREESEKKALAIFDEVPPPKIDTGAAS